MVRPCTVVIQCVYIPRTVRVVDLLARPLRLAAVHVTWYCPGLDRFTVILLVALAITGVENGIIAPRLSTTVQRRDAARVAVQLNEAFSLNRTLADEGGVSVGGAVRDGEK